MARKAASFAIALVAGSVASAQVVLHGVRGNGDVIQIDPMTGAAMLLGSSGRVVQVGSSGSTSCGKWPWLLPLVVDESPPQPAFAWLSPCDGRTIQLEEWFNAPPGARVQAVAGDPDAFCAVGLYLVLETSGGGALGRMNLDHRVFTSIGPTGRNDLVALARSPPVNCSPSGPTGAAACTCSIPPPARRRWSGPARSATPVPRRFSPMGRCWRAGAACRGSILQPARLQWWARPASQISVPCRSRRDACRPRCSATRTVVGGEPGSVSQHERLRLLPIAIRRGMHRAVKTQHPHAGIHAARGAWPPSDGARARRAPGS